MALGTVERRMARKKTAAEPLESVKLPADVMKSARIVATLSGETIGDVLAGILRPALVRREREEMAKRAKQVGGEK